VRCTEYVERLAKTYYTKTGIRRSFNKCFLHLRFPYGLNEQAIYSFFNSPRVVAEQYNQFLGTFCIDLSEHLYSTEEPAFKMLTRFIAENKQSIMFIFVIGSNDEKSIVNVFSILNKTLRIERLNMDYENTETYVEYALSLLKNKVMQVESGVIQVLGEYIEELSQKKMFSGYDTILRLTDDIVYEMCLANKKSLSAKYLTELREELLPEDMTTDNGRIIGFR
jgi:hypothetical protein